MKEYLVDYEELAKLVDTLIAQKYPNELAEEHKGLREKSISELDEAIGTAIFRELSQPELDKLNQLLNQESTTEKDYDNFLKETKLDLAKITEKAAKDYAKKFLAGNKEGDRNV